MARFAHIVGGLVVNLVEVDPDQPFEPMEGHLVDLDADPAVAIGWGYDEAEGFIAAPPAPAPVPQVVSRAQLKLALYEIGLLDQVEAFASQAERPIQIMWAERTEFDRYHPLLKRMIAAFGMSDEQADDIFRLAATL